ncbi:MAG TPA: BrnT family toxin [Trueperaceae bacterium]|nr:BrnT family toxin [Trueperaceae bacterium]
MPDEFEWDDDNEGHIARHGVSPDEVEEVFYNDPLTAPAYNQGAERRYAKIGVTDAGRLLCVVFTHRKGRIRIVTAVEANPAETRRYRDR